jgi:predicted transcriptional regulator
MDNAYATLQTIYSIVKDDPDPVSYPCKPAQIIVRQFLPWDTMLVHINQLHEKGLVQLQQNERFTVIRITREGFMLAGKEEARRSKI